MAAKWSIFDDFSGCMDLKYRRAAILSRPHFCISDTLIHPPNYPEELGATRELGRAHGFSPSASGMLSRAHISLPFQSLRKMADDTFFEPRLVRRVFRRTSLCQVCGKSIITAAEIHYSAYHFQHCGGRVILLCESSAHIMACIPASRIRSSGMARDQAVPDAA